MRPDDVKRVEAAVRGANPVPFTDGHSVADAAAEVTLLVEHRRHPMTTTSPTTTPPARTPRRRLAWAFAAAAAVTLLAGGTALLLTRGDDPAPAAATTVPPRVLTLAGHNGGPVSVAWSPDGSRLAAAYGMADGADGATSIWDATTGAELLLIPLDMGEYNLAPPIAFSPDGTRLAIGGSGKGAFDATTGERLAVLSEFLAWSPDGTQVVAGGAWSWSGILDAATGDEVLAGPRSPSWVWAADWGPDGARIATDRGPDVTIWDAATGEEILIIRNLGYLDVHDLAWSPDGSRIATTWGTEARIWDAATGDRLATLSGHEGDDAPRLTGPVDGVRALAWSPDGTRVATAGSDGTARLWDAATGEELAIWSDHEGEVTGVAWSPDGTRVATAGRDGTVRIREVGPAPAPADAAPATTAAAGTTTPAAAGPAGTYAWGSGALSVWVTPAEMTEFLRDLSLRYHGIDPGEAAFTPTGGDLVWTAGDWSITVHAGGGYHPTPDLTDPRLPEGAKYGGLGQSYGFSGPNSDAAICITLATPKTTTVDDEPVLDGEPDFEDIMLEIGTFFLQEMGWVG